MQFNTSAFLLSATSALRCYSNGKGGLGAPAPYKYEQDQKDASIKLLELTIITPAFPTLN
jgi:hypothetical protein